MIDLGYFLDAKCDNKKTSLWRPGYTCWSPSSSEGCGGRDQSLCGGCVLRGCNHAVHSRKSVSFLLWKKGQNFFVHVQKFLSGFWFFRRAPTSTRRSRSSSWPKSRSTTRHVSMHAILHYLLYLKGTNNNLFLFRCRAASLWRRTAPSVTCCRWMLPGFFLDSIKVPWRYLISLLFFVDAFCVSNFFWERKYILLSFLNYTQAAERSNWVLKVSLQPQLVCNLIIRGPFALNCVLLVPNKIVGAIHNFTSLD